MRVDAPPLEIWMGLARTHRGMVGRVTSVMTQRSGHQKGRVVDAPALEICMGLAGGHRGRVGEGDVLLTPAVQCDQRGGGRCTRTRDLDGSGGSPPRPG